jgi:hypothetical protein
MTTTLNDIKGRIKQILQGYSRNQEQITWLAQPMLATDTSFTVDTSTATAMTRGLVEIGNELILVNNFNNVSGLVNVSASTNGRGVQNTVASTHSINDIVTMDPDFPRQRIFEAINQTIAATYPDLYQMATTDFKKVAARYEYDMPADVEDIVRVTVETIGPSRVWFPAQSWRFNPQADIVGGDPSASLTGKTLQIMDFIVPGRTVHVVYSKAPGLFVNDTDDFTTTTGYPERVIDMIMYGAVARLLSGIEPARLQQKAVESTLRAPLVPTGAATNASNYFWNLYRQRMQEEVDRLHQLFPTYQTFLA